MIPNVSPDERNIGFVFQNYALWPHMTVGRNISYPLKMRKYTREKIRKETAKILKLVRLEGKLNRYPHQLSGGEQQRVALGRALIMNPDLLLLDEPLSNLDARLREEMQIEIRRIQQELNLTVIHVTHDQSEALGMSDRVAVMNRGVIVQIGKPEDVYNHPENRFAADFVGTNNIIHADEGSFCVRPEDISFSCRDNRDGTGRKGQIVRRIFKGAHIQYDVRTDSGLLKVQTHPGNLYSVGDSVECCFRRITKIGRCGKDAKRRRCISVK